MKFVAVIRQVPDGESKLRIQGDRVDLSGATMILDQMDEYAVEEAIRLKERHGGEAVVVGFGPERTEEAIRTALAMGMDRGVHVVYEGFADPVAVAEALVEVLKEEAPTLVLTGGQQADWDSQALGGALAEALGVPVVAWTTALELEGDTAKAKHDLEGAGEPYPQGHPDFRGDPGEGQARQDPGRQGPRGGGRRARAAPPRGGQGHLGGAYGARSLGPRRKPAQEGKPRGPDPGP